MHVMSTPDFFSMDGEVLQAAREWLMAGHEVALVTVLKTWGSSPRPPGSLLVMRRDGVHQGSVSGGCVEEDLLARYKQGELSESLPTLVDYGVNRQEATRFGLPCGGRLELLIEALDAPSELDSVLDAIAGGRLVAREVDMRTGRTRLMKASPDVEFTCHDDKLTRVFGPAWKMLLIGAGHLAQHVSRIALMLNYEVIVCDPREEYASEWAVSGTRLVPMMPDEAVNRFACHGRGIVLALTHDPRLDDMALLDALASNAFYVGAIGSQRNSEQRRERLQGLGLSHAQLQRLHAPVGLPIGSHTPAEIAVSILAEITALRNSGMASRGSGVISAA